MNRDHPVIADLKAKGSHVGNENVDIYYRNRDLYYGDFTKPLERCAIGMQWCQGCCLPACIKSLRHQANYVAVVDKHSEKFTYDEFRWKTPSWGVEVWNVFASFVPADKENLLTYEKAIFILQADPTNMNNRWEHSMGNVEKFLGD